MKKYKILLAAAALLGLSSCIEETLPTEYVLNDQIQASESALQGMVNSTRFSSMNTLTLKDLPDNLASSGNSLLSMIMQLSMSIGVTIAGLLLGLFGSQHVSVDSGTTQTVFMYTWLSMALIIALPAFIFARVPNDTHQNVAISRRKRSAQ